ncbi:MAG TPA: polyprenyl synthetase family protein [Gammaproteobacteria bacterium]|nr:polyprenyl synthetase family protein [Gammaproteobacteria bacterium]
MKAKEKRARPKNATDHFFATLAYYRDLVLARIDRLVPKNRYQRTLYGPMLEYPLREGKGLRPALCLSMCQACGGRLEDGLDTAAALEMFHNAFLIHDDIEDHSEQRRGQPTLHAKYGVPIATNVGDGLNMLALRTLLHNVETLGPERALTIIRDVERMARESTEGQSIELDWVYSNTPDVRLRDYLLMCYKKTCWYTCIAPLRVGALIAKLHPRELSQFNAFGFKVGAAFQIQDDVLNLTAEEHLYGKEIGGDLAEGKRTLMVVHAMGSASAAGRRRLLAIYAKARSEKTQEELRFVYDTMQALGSIDFAIDVARRLTLRAKKIFDNRLRWIPPSPHRMFLQEMIEYMIERKL